MIRETLRCLVAEDELTTRLLLVHLAQEAGFVVEQATDGLATWNRLCEAPPIDLVLLDWMMPELDGLMISHRLRAELRESYPYVLMVTAREDAEDAALALKAGADDFVRKPFDGRELLARLGAARRLIEHLTRTTSPHLLVPVCMHCHRIRGADGSWQRLEVFMATNLSVRVSHSLCQTCLKANYPDLSETIDKTPTDHLG